MPKESIKAAISLKGETLQQLVDALARAADEFGGQLVRDAVTSATIKLEANDSDDLNEAISDVMRAVAVSDGVEAQISLPGSAWHERRVAGPTPMEQMINRATPLESVTLSSSGRSVTLTADTGARAKEWAARTQQLHGGGVHPDYVTQPQAGDELFED